MGLFSLFILAVGLSMDAFSVAVCKGLAMQKITVKKACIIGLWFGGFQAGMPLIGYLLGVQFESTIKAVDHWITFILLSLIGIGMIKEAFSKEELPNDSLAFKEMLVLSLATSIDALAVGVTFALIPDVSIVAAVSFIGLITFFMSAVGLKIGNVFGVKYKKRAELTGGIILIGIGLKILIEHLFF